MITRRQTGPVFKAEAVYSDCESYRYSLVWRWEAGPMLLFVMLNPSTATEAYLDRTVASCLQRAQRGGFYGAMGVANLFGYRSTDPNALMRVEDAVGADNDKCLGALLAQSGAVICGWGNHAYVRHRQHRVRAVLDMIRAYGLTPMALKINKDGSPQHPLYIAKAVQPVILEMAA